jgi:hypothetical protein
VSGLENAGHWVMPSLCTYAAFTTLNRSLVQTVLDPGKGPEQFSGSLPWLAGLVALYIVAGWGVFGWRRWAPWVTVAVFGRYIYAVVSAQGTQPRALAEASLFAAACLWFLLPDVRARFAHGRWI